MPIKLLLRSDKPQLQDSQQWRRELDYLRTIESFVAVASSGSFSAAAEQLGISRALVTRHVGDLESRLGARLLNRTTRRLSLSAIGLQYLDLARKLLADVHQAEISTRQGQNEPEGLLTIVAPKSFGGTHFSTAVAEFSAEHPRLKIMLILDDDATRSLQISKNDYDIAIRLAPIQSKSAAVVRRIGSLEWILCASPAYLADAPGLETPKDLGRHNCLLHTALAADRIWRFASSDVSVKVGGTFTSNSVLALRRAAISGLGVVQLPTYYISDDLKLGRLVEVLPNHPLAERPVFALLPGNRLVPKKTKLFVRFIAAWYKTRPWQDVSRLTGDI